MLSQLKMQSGSAGMYKRNYLHRLGMRRRLISCVAFIERYTSVAYAIADNPFGPFKRIGKILQQDPEIATGAGHHSVIHEPKSDKYYIIYHRRPLTETDGNHRATCIDEMTFDKHGYINPVKITFEGVKSNPLK